VWRSPESSQKAIVLIYKNPNKELAMLGNEGDWKVQFRIEKARRQGGRTLDLSYMELTELPEAIASLTQLQQLDLCNNQLTELPEAISSLTQLRQLYLSYNQLRELPEAIASLT
ncbi:leucine-rich repeat domain-containing protein, partial [Microcoleus sp. herbarium2]|uniref:leucine-rich repeat domain-containing protein n=1 Tax=Microcoleus sp. herbarium2 TaxID=3055433 RepID=UPI002FCF7A4B